MNTSQFNSFVKPTCDRIPECNSFVSEELEAEEDELRRNEEIKEMMLNAFDDLDDECQSVNSSSYLASLSGCNSKTTHSESSPWNFKINYDDKRLDPSTIHRCKPNENEQKFITQAKQLEAELNDLRIQFKEEKSKWLEKFFIEEEEKKLAQKKHEELNKLFYESQVMLLQRENELKEYQEKFQILEKEKHEALKQVTMNELVIQELKQRLASQEEKNCAKEEEVSNLMKKISSLDDGKFSSYQKEIENLNEKLVIKDKKCQDLEQQLLELQQLHRSTITEKSGTISKLISNLETCQLHCQKIMLNSNHRIDQSRTESSESLHKLKEICPSSPVFSKNDSKLFEQLFQANAAVKEKSSEIKFLQEQLKSCVKQIKSGKEIETKSIEEVKALKEKLVNLERRNHQLMYENQQIKNKKLNFEQETNVDQSDDENDQLFPIENQNVTSSNSERCQKLRKINSEFSASKEKLLLQNQQLQADLIKLGNENSVLNEIVKTLNNDMPLIPIHCDSFGQESIMVKDSLQNNEISKNSNFCTNNELEDLRNKLKTCENQLRENDLQHAKQLEVLQTGIREYISSTETTHQQKIKQLEEEYTKKILNIESKHQEQFNQFEIEFKEQVLKISVEEIGNLSSVFQKHFDDMSNAVNRLRNDLNDKNALVDVLKKQLEDANNELNKRNKALDDLKSEYEISSNEWKKQLDTTNEKHEKLVLEIDKVYEKYKAARKAAIDLKQMLIARSQLLFRYQQFYTQTLNEIQNYLNETLECKSINEKNTAKFDITKEDLIVPDDEINAAIIAIKKQLESLNHK